MRSKKELIAIIARGTYGDAQRDGARAELDAVLAEESTTLIQSTRENLVQTLGEFGSEIVRLRDVINTASADASSTSHGLVLWTRVLALATVGLTLATGGLVYATIRLASSAPH
ncbi:MAG: hypothetical protein ABSA52_11380 [Candidatus Binatia bacterium]|jgi:hypothetical protein